MRRLLLSLVLALSLLLAGCGTGRESSGALLYFCTDPNDHSQLHGPAIQSHNTFEDPDVVSEKAFDGYTVTDCGIEMVLPAASVVEVRLKK